MSGLDKIISDITEQSKLRSDELLRTSREEAERLLSESHQKALAEKEQRQKKLDEKLSVLENNSRASARLASSKIILTAKHEAAAEMLCKAVAIIDGLSKKEYFEIIKKLILKNARKGEDGIIRFSKTDSKRLPQNFLESIEKNLDGAKLTLGKPADINDGFILSYGLVDVNCTFDAVTSDKSDEINDGLNKILFEA
ncbi:MAG: V-type ATP synthase subunit E [Candidatus Fimenecus sp.]